MPDKKYTLPFLSFLYYNNQKTIKKAFNVCQQNR